MFTIQTSLVCILLWTLGRSEPLEPLVPSQNESQIYPTTTILYDCSALTAMKGNHTNILYDCSALTAMKGNLTTGGQYLGSVFPTLSLLSRGTVLLESSTKDCFESVKNMPYDPQNTSYLNLARNCENSIYWYPYKSTGRQRRKYKKFNKRKLKENLSILEALEFDIWKIKVLRKSSSVSFGLFPIQLVLQGILLTSTFVSYVWSFDLATYYVTSPPSSSPTQSPIKEFKLPVTLVPDRAVPSNIQIFVKFQDPDGQPRTKTTMIRNNGNLFDLRSSIQLIFPQLLRADFYLTLNGKILNDHTLLCFQDLAFKTIEIQLRLRGGMMQPEPPKEMNVVMQMLLDIQKKLELSLEANEKLQQRIEKLETKELEEEIEAELDTSEADDPFTTPTRTKAPSFKVDDVQRTPFLKRSKNMSGRPSESIPTSTGTTSTTSTTSTGISSTTSTTSTGTHAMSAVSPSSSTISTKNRGFKPVTNADLKVYQVGHSWEAWYRRFQFVAHSCSWSDGEKVATLCHFMPEEIKEFLENLSAESFKDCESLSKILEDLFDLYEKTEEEREKDFLNITCKPRESVATYYLRFRNLATLAKETRNEKLMKYFANSLRPLQLHQKVMEKMHKCSTLAEIYQLALVEEKELARLRKLRNEEKDTKKGMRKVEIEKTNKSTPQRNNNNNNNNYKNNNNHTNNRNNNNTNNNNNNNNNYPKKEPSTNWLVQNHRCAYCTKPTNDRNHPHQFEECRAKYPFYRAKEVRELIQAKKEVPARTAWSEDPQSRTNANKDTAAPNLKGQAGLNL
jgi:hypothetical protein